MKKAVWLPAVKFMAIATLLTGMIYPLAVSSVSNMFFPFQAEGSLVKRGQATVGSILIGQNFTSDKYFWGRPSATTPMPYNAAASAASNLSPRNENLTAAVKDRAEDLARVNPAAGGPVPADLVTASGSGLDPHISKAAALYQVARVAAARSVPEEKIKALVEKTVEGPWLGILGEKRVNVLQLNLALDAGTF
jgi:potassium-transporting ATPase KdpC subunit